MADIKFEIKKELGILSESAKGWRKELIGNELMDLLEGKLVLSIKDGKVAVEPLRRKRR